MLELMVTPAERVARQLNALTNEGRPNEVFDYLGKLIRSNTPLPDISDATWRRAGVDEQSQLRATTYDDLVGEQRQNATQGMLARQFGRSTGGKEAWNLIFYNRRLRELCSELSNVEWAKVLFYTHLFGLPTRNRNGVDLLNKSMLCAQLTAFIKAADLTHPEEFTVSMKRAASRLRSFAQSLGVAAPSSKSLQDVLRDLVFLDIYQIKPVYYQLRGGNFRAERLALDPAMSTPSRKS